MLEYVADSEDHAVKLLLEDAGFLIDETAPASQEASRLNGLATTFRLERGTSD